MHNQKTYKINKKYSKSSKNVMKLMQQKQSTISIKNTFPY